MKTELSTKLEFLKYHGFKSLVKEYDSNLRNHIAHHNYQIDESGNLFIKEKKIDLASKLDSLTQIVLFSGEIFDETSKRYDNFLKKQRKN